ncbi:hypothetical protein BGX38DRAFT_66639 [Terfezia claveryi]|nr:hypothetical protein BGX38DRAFT_66639 [Terfezia claveryi]
MSETTRGQQLLTVWDTGAVVCVAPRSTMDQTKTKWKKGSDINFVLADGVLTSPIGVAERYVFKLQEKSFAVRVYVVERASYQLLLGTEFMVATGAALFPRWSRIIITIPGKLEIEAFCKRVSTMQEGVAPLKEEEGIDENELEKGVPLNLVLQANPTLPAKLVELSLVPTNIALPIPFLQIQKGSAALKIGMRDLVDEVDGPPPIPDIQISPEDIERAQKAGLPVLTVEFVKNNMQFGPEVPEEIKRLVCEDIIEYADACSWNQFDLGHIKDIPHTINRWDPIPAIEPSRKHLSNPINTKILRSKCWPLVELGIYFKAPPHVKDKAQVTIVRKGTSLEERNDPANCRVAHDYRRLNEKIYLDPERG